MRTTIDIYCDAPPWQEGKHPRGQPKNKGEFAKKGEQSATPASTAQAEPSWGAYKSLPPGSPEALEALKRLVADPRTNLQNVARIMTTHPTEYTPAEKYAVLSKVRKATTGGSTSTPPEKIEKTEKTESSSLPLPNEKSPLQKKLYGIAIATTKSNAEKVKALQAEIQYPGDHAEKYKVELINALGGAPEEPGDTIHPPETSKFYQHAVTLRKGARELYSADDDGAVDIVPSLAKGFWNKVDPLARSTITDYTGTGFRKINRALRNGDAPPDVVQKIAAVDKLFESDAAKCTADVVLHRGEDVPNDVIDKWADALVKDTSCRYSKSGFVSTSLSNSPAMSHKNTQFEIVVRKGTSILGIDRISQNQGENEVLMQHGQTFEVYEIKRTPQTTYVKMVAV